MGLLAISAPIIVPSAWFVLRGKGAPFGITSPQKMSALVDLLLRTNAPRRCFVDLGSGDGRVCKSVLENLKFEKATGVDLNPFLIGYSRLRHVQLRKAEWKCEDFRKTDLKDASVVYIFGMRALLEEMRQKFEEELPEDAMVVVNGFGFDGATPFAVEKVHMPEFTGEKGKEHGVLNLYRKQDIVFDEPDIEEYESLQDYFKKNS